MRRGVKSALPLLSRFEYTSFSGCWFLVTGKHDVIHKTGSTERFSVLREDRAMTIDNMRKIGEDQTRSSGDMLPERRIDINIKILHSATGPVCKYYPERHTHTLQTDRSIWTTTASITTKSKTAYNQSKSEAVVVSGVQRLCSGMRGQCNVQQRTAAAAVVIQGCRRSVTAATEWRRRQYAPALLPNLRAHTCSRQPTTSNWTKNISCFH